MKRFVFVLTLLLLLPLSAFGYNANSQIVQTLASVSGQVQLKDIDEYGGVAINISGEDFQKAGFDYADLVKVSIAGKNIEMPVVPTYLSAISGSPMMILPKNKKRNMTMQVCYSDFAKTYNIAKRINNKDKSFYWVPAKGVKFPLTLTVTLSKKEGYKKEYEIYNLVRTYKRTDYKHLTDAEFANFREISTKNIGRGRLYRSSTPINTRTARNFYVDRLCREAKIKTFLNLCDTEQAARALPGFRKTYYSSQNIVFSPLNVDVNSKLFANGIRDVVKAMLNPNAYPCLVHCIEGQDRTGFTCAMIELFMGADYASVEADYLKTFMNYYGVKEGSEQYKTLGRNIYLNLDRAFATQIKDYKGFDKSKTQELARLYLKSLGFSNRDLNLLWDNLAK